MDSELLRAFLDAAESGSLSRAARNLGISQPSLSARIQRLEQHLGAPLFTRHARGVRLTEVGEVLVPRARQLLQDVGAAEAAVRREQVATERMLAVGAIPTIAPYLLPSALQRLRASQPGVRVTLREAVSAVLVQQLHDGALDVVIAALPYAFGSLDTEVLGVDALTVAVPHTHPAVRAGRITLAQLRESPAITLDPAHCLGEQVEGFCASRALSPSVVCRSAQLTTVLELVGSGAGVSIVPAMAAARHNTPHCAYLPLLDHELQREIVAVWRRGEAAHAEARAFVDSVRVVVRGW